MPEVSCSSTKRDPKKRGCGLFSEQDPFDGGRLPAVRCDWVDAACFRGASAPPGQSVMVTKRARTRLFSAATFVALHTNAEILRFAQDDNLVLAGESMCVPGQVIDWVRPGE